MMFFQAFSTGLTGCRNYSKNQNLLTMKSKIKILSITMLLFFAAVSARADIFSCAEFNIPHGTTAYDFLWDWNSTDILGNGVSVCCNYTNIVSFSAYDIYAGQWVFYDEPLHFGSVTYICSIDLPPSCCCYPYGGIIYGCY